jgi:hypothetical protein
MGLGREMGDHVGAELGEGGGDRLRVADVGVDEAVAGVVGDLGERAGAAGIGQRIIVST